MLRILALLVLLLALSPARAVSSVLLLELDGVIGPASKDFVLRGLATAQTRNAELVILRMNTPGGLDDSMRDIIQAILASPIPVASYVAPSGARAASAGTYILYASHIAAMAPATNLGAATPVQIGGGFPDGPDEQTREPAEKPAAISGPANDQAQNKPSGQSSDQSAQSDDTDPDEVLDRPPDESIDKPLSGSAMERKITNDARAYIRALAQLRGRNVEWAEQAVVQAASLSAQDALAKNVIDLVAVNVADLLTQLEGRTVQVAGTDRILNLDEPVIETLQPDWRNQLLAIITHPQVAYILMLLGIYGLFFELSNPGALIPGVLGGICLVLALFAFQVLPVNYAGLALIILGFGFMIAEAFVPSFGILGLGGVVAFITGSVILWDDQSGAFDVPLVLIIGFALASAVVFVGLGTLAWRSNRHPPVSGDAALLGTTATVLDTIPAHSTGWVRLHGESWRARNAQEQTLTAGETVRIRAREGLLLTVAPEDTHAA